MSFNVCPRCDANLDPGEKCDCRLTQQNVIDIKLASYAIKDNQICENSQAVYNTEEVIA